MSDPQNRSLPKLTMGEARLVERGEPPAPFWLSTVHRRTGAPYRGRMAVTHHGPTPKSSGGWGRTAAWQISVCAMAVLAVLALKVIGAPWARQTLQDVDYALSTPTSLEDLGNVGDLTFLDSVKDKVQAVFASSSQSTAVFAWPVKATAAVQSNGNSLLIPGSGYVTAAMDGQVFYVGENETLGPYIRICHTGGWDTIYAPVNAQVNVGDTVLAGQPLGTFDGTLHFEIWSNGQQVDAAALLPSSEGT